MKVYQRLAQAFKAEGVTATVRHDGRRQHVLAARAAQARASRCTRCATKAPASAWPTAGRAPRTQPGVATATCGPGVTQLATAFVTAARADSPLVAFCGEYPTQRSGIHAVPRPGARSPTPAKSGFVRLHIAEHADEAVRKAFYLAKLERRPIMLSCPMDMQQKEFEDDEPYVPSTDAVHARHRAADPRQ